MSKLIYAQSKTGFELAFPVGTARDAINKSIVFTTDGYLWTHGNYFRILPNDATQTIKSGTASAGSVTLTDVNSVTLGTIDVGVTSVTASGILTAGALTSGAIALTHNNSALTAGTFGATANSADSIVVPKVVTDQYGHLTTGTTSFTATLNQVKTTVTITDGDQYITFAASGSTGTSELNKAAALKFNPGTGALSATTFIGTLTNKFSVTLNGAAKSEYNNSAAIDLGSIYAPTTSGTTNTGTYLTPTTGAAPVWQAADTTVTQNSTKLVTSGAVYTAVNAAVATADAMVYKGVLDANSSALPAGNKGDTYKISVAGTFNGTKSVEVGDLIICNTDSTAAVAYANIIAASWNNWDIIQVNIDGAVSYTSATATVVGEIALFDSTNGRLIKTSGKILSILGGNLASATNPTAISLIASNTSGVVSYYTLSGSGTTVALTNGPTFVNPTLGTATATSINGLTINTTTGILTIANGKTATINNTLTFQGTDSSTINFGGGGTVAYTANKLSVFAATTSAELAGVINDETGSGNLVFNTSPTFKNSVTFGSSTATNDTIIIAPNASAGTSYAGTITPAELTAARTWTMPDAGGTVALTTSTVTAATNLAGGTGGSLPYQSAANTTTFLGIGTSGYILASTGTAPAWIAPDKLIVGASSAAVANATATNGNVYINLIGNTNTVRSYNKISGTGATTVTSDSSGNITINSLNSWRAVNAYAWTSATPGTLTLGSIAAADLDFGDEFIWNSTATELKLGWAEVATNGTITYSV